MLILLCFKYYSRGNKSQQLFSEVHQHRWDLLLALDLTLGSQWWKPLPNSNITSTCFFYHNSVLYQMIMHEILLRRHLAKIKYGINSGYQKYGSAPFSTILLYQFKSYRGLHLMVDFVLSLNRPFWIQNHFCATFGGWEICKTKWDFWLDDSDQPSNYLI